MPNLVMNCYRIVKSGSCRLNWWKCALSQEQDSYLWEGDEEQVKGRVSPRMLGKSWRQINLLDMHEEKAPLLSPHFTPQTELGHLIGNWCRFWWLIDCGERAKWFLNLESSSQIWTCLHTPLNKLFIMQFVKINYLRIKYIFFLSLTDVWKILIFCRRRKFI